MLTSTKANWLTDRWQAAVDMSGRPIPGQHYIRIDFGKGIKRVERVVLDYEVAYCGDYYFVLESERHDRTKVVYDATTPNSYGTVTITNDVKNKSIEHSIKLNGLVLEEDEEEEYEIITIHLRKPGTQWGTSLWEVQVWGVMLDD